MPPIPRLDAEAARLRRELRLDTPGLDIVGVGVDRLDYTKGIPERLCAIDRLLTQTSRAAGRLAFVQIGVPSRSKLESYASIEKEIDELVADINCRHGDGPDRGPIRYRKASSRSAGWWHSTGWPSSASSALCMTG